MTDQLQPTKRRRLNPFIDIEALGEDSDEEMGLAEGASSSFEYIDIVSSSILTILSSRWFRR